jgi:hypothetical protein
MDALSEALVVVPACGRRSVAIPRNEFRCSALHALGMIEA